VSSSEVAEAKLISLLSLDNRQMHSSLEGACYLSLKGFSGYFWAEQAFARKA
jgi:hypothetical protein